jgi:D-sedoheptulose 7-phosphate isomerase
MSRQEVILSRIEGSLAAIGFLRDELQTIDRICEVIAASLADGGTIYTAGNGGSAAQALHLAEELIGRYRSNRPALRSICLNADPTVLTCIANDFGYEEVFARQCEALLRPNDVLIVLSTSGNSENIVRALRTAASKRSTCIGLLGKTGGHCLALTDYALVVPGGDSAHVQEAHQVIIHLICETLETFDPQQAAQNQPMD